MGDATMKTNLEPNGTLLRDTDFGGFRFTNNRNGTVGIALGYEVLYTEHQLLLIDEGCKRE
jgi:hypothetical protein